MRLTFLKLICLCLMLFGFCCSVSAEEFVGIVKSVKGGAVIERSGETFTITPGMEIMQVDIIKTDAEGSAGLIFSDDTCIAMGPNTEIVLNNYQFEPKEKRLSFVVRMIRGTLSFLSGQMTKLSPESVQLVMPTATIGVRGTHVLIKVD